MTDINTMDELDVDALMASVEADSEMQSEVDGIEQPIEQAPNAAMVRTPLSGTGVRNSNDVTLELKAELGVAVVSLGELASLSKGSTLTLNTVKDDPIRITDVRGTEVAKGEIELIDGSYTIVVTEVMGNI